MSNPVLHLRGLTRSFEQGGVRIDVLRGVDDSANHVLMVGHNPGLEDLVFDLVPDDGSSPLRDVVEEKFPTAALAVITFETDDWGAIRTNSGTLVRFVRPRDLDVGLGPED